ncbi:hypothetical protein PSV3_00314 [Septimatrevirus PSV34]|uniref:Uncharacterized protein n=1 Tax=Pseudomonas phage PSV3 TaxID=3003632 RepID=A0AAF0AQ29_9CAUD|nr:tail protein [Pseudomonas phage PSV3]WBF77015.1 hypothetical protein PSV3_00314 [Pseudomonas phage PSV3]
MTAPDNFSSSPILSLESAPYNGGGVLLNAYASTVASETRNDTSGSLVVTGVSQASIEGLQQYTTLDQARDGSAFLLINNELFVYVGFVDNGGGQITFPNVYRGVLDTTPGNHAANDRVWFISGTDGLLPELISVGTTRYVKLLDTTSGGKLDISLAPSFSGSLTNRAGLPLPPQYLTLAGSRTPSPQVGATSIAVAWRNRSRADTLLRVYSDAAVPNACRKPHAKPTSRRSVDCCCMAQPQPGRYPVARV